MVPDTVTTFTKCHSNSEMLSVPLEVTQLLSGTSQAGARTAHFHFAMQPNQKTRIKATDLTTSVVRFQNKIYDPEIRKPKGIPI